jgi:biopolymer transport protein ExbD
MASLFHRSKLRRAERAPVTAHGNINLVPLVDILTSIVFFSLLTYQGAAMLALTSFDLSLPPVVVSTPEQASKVKSEQNVLNLLLAVRVDNAKLTVEHSGGGGYRSEIAGLGPSSLDQLQTLMTQIATQYPQNHDVLVIPSDDVSYDNLVHVLERLRLARYSGISLGTRARIASRPAGGNGGGE